MKLTVELTRREQLLLLEGLTHDIASAAVRARLEDDPSALIDVMEKLHRCELIVEELS